MLTGSTPVQAPVCWSLSYKCFQHHLKYTVHSILLDLLHFMAVSLLSVSLGLLSPNCWSSVAKVSPVCFTVHTDSKRCGLLRKHRVVIHSY